MEASCLTCTQAPWSEPCVRFWLTMELVTTTFLGSSALSQWTSGLLARRSLNTKQDIRTQLVVVTETRYYKLQEIITNIQPELIKQGGINISDN